MMDKEESRLQATGIILAGGKNTRMGTNKALLKLHGQALIERSLEILGGIFSEVLISSNKRELYPYGVEVIPDIFPEKGPLGGLHSCLKAARCTNAFFVACDMPFLNPNLIRYLVSIGDDCDIVVPSFVSGLHPLHALYSKNCLPYIEENLKADRLKILDFYKNCKVRYVTETELAHFGDLEEMFCNVNTPTEWGKLTGHDAFGTSIDI